MADLAISVQTHSLPIQNNSILLYQKRMAFKRQQRRMLKLVIHNVQTVVANSDKKKSGTLGIKVSLQMIISKSIDFVFLISTGRLWYPVWACIYCFVPSIIMLAKSFTQKLALRL